MAITYPLSLPSDTAFQAIRLRPSSVVAEVRSVFTLQSQVQAHAGDMWSLEALLKPMKRSEAAPWLSFFLALNGKQGTFLLHDASSPDPQGTGGGTPQVNGASQTGKILNTKGWNPAELVLKQGDYLSIGSGVSTRLYMVVNADVTSDGGGLATIDIWPRLRESPADSAAITLTKAKGTFRMADTIPSWEPDISGFYRMGFTAVEAF